MYEGLRTCYFGILSSGQKGCTDVLGIVMVRRQHVTFEVFSTTH